MPVIAMPWSRRSFRSMLWVTGLLVAAVVFQPLVASAQSPGIVYLYDDLNRLVRVIRADGEAATYHYDGVGNILRITRESGVPLTTVVSQASTSTLRRGETTTITLTGFNFPGAVVTTTAGLVVTAQETGVDTLVLRIEVDPAAPLGTGTVTIRTPYGTTDVPLTIQAAAPVVTAFTPAQALPGMTVSVSGANFDPSAGAASVRVNGTDATVLAATSSSLTFRIPAGASSGPITVTTASGTGTSGTALVVGTLGSHRAALPTSDLLAYWTFDVDGRDDASGTFPFTLEGGLGPTVWGPLSRALPFPGSAARVATRPQDDAAFNFGAADFSLSLWARFNTTSGEQVLIEKCAAALCESAGWSLVKRTDHTLAFGPLVATAPGTIVGGRWYHIAIVRAGTTIAIYLDGAVVAQASVGATTIPAVTDPLRVGERAGAQTFPMNGVIDEVGVWNRALTAAEVTTVATTASLFPPGTLGEAFAGTVIDTTKWSVSAPLGTSTVTQNDALLATSDGTAGTFTNTPGLFGPGAGVGANCLLSGNFTVEVALRDFSAAPGGYTQAFVGLFTDADNQLHIKRILGPGANGIQTVRKAGGVMTSGGVVSFGGSAVRVRVRRTSGHLIETAADTGAGFQTHLAPVGFLPGDFALSLVLLGPGGSASAVTYDDVVVQEGTVLCPIEP